MKKSASYHQQTPFSCQWLWYTRENQFQFGPSFTDRFFEDTGKQRLTTDEWLTIFLERDRPDIQNALDLFKQNGRGKLRFTGELLPDNGGHRGGQVTGAGETLTFIKGRPELVSGSLHVASPDHQPEISGLDDSYLLELIMDKLPYSIFFKDRESRFIKISRECTQKFGISTPGEAVGKTDSDFFEEEHAKKALRDEKKILRTGNTIEDKLEKEVLPGDPPKVQWASTTKMPLYDRNNRMIGTFGITSDVTEQYKTEQALKESESKYRSIFENIHDVYYRTNREGLVTEISPSIESYSGYSREEVLGRPVSNFYYFPNDRDRLVARLKKDQVVTDFEIRLANKQNKLMYASVSAKIVRNEDHEIIAVEGIMRDITDRKQAENNLREAHTFYDQILNSTSEGIYVVNQDFEYIYWNTKMEEISGMSQMDVLGKQPFDLFPQIHQEKLIYKYKKAFSGETLTSGDYHYEIPSTGKKGWAQAYYTPLHSKSGQIENVLVAISDISDRKKAEDELRKSDETLTKLSEQVPGAIYQFQQYPDGSSRFPFASDAFYSIYEVYPEEVSQSAGKAIRRIHPDDFTNVQVSIRHSFKTLEPWELDYRVQLPAKGTRWLRGRARPEKQEDGSVIWHGYLYDITEKKQRENELRETLNIVSDQNSRLTNFAHIVSHNLRNHAGNISSLLSLYESEESEEERLQLFSYLEMASSRLNEAIQDLNEIIDKQSGSSNSISTVNVNDYFLKIKEILSTDIIVNNVRFDISMPDHPVIEYHPAYLESILLNLISNAIKYRHPDRQPVISVHFNLDGEFPVLTVADNGLGIDLDKHRSKLFGMYNTFHDNENSKGIGLYITKNQVESLGGTIGVESRVGSGSTFTVKLACSLARYEQETR